MHPVVQGIVAVSCLALVAMGGYALTQMDEPREVVEIETPPDSRERALENHCNLMRRMSPEMLARAGIDPATNPCFRD